MTSADTDRGFVLYPVQDLSELSFDFLGTFLSQARDFGSILLFYL